MASTEPIHTRPLQRLPLESLPQLKEIPAEGKGYNRKATELRLRLLGIRPNTPDEGEFYKQLMESHFADGILRRELETAEQKLRSRSPGEPVGALLAEVRGKTELDIITLELYRRVVEHAVADTFESEKWKGFRLTPALQTDSELALLGRMLAPGGHVATMLGRADSEPDIAKKAAGTHLYTALNEGKREFNLDENGLAFNEGEITVERVQGESRTPVLTYPPVKPFKVGDSIPNQSTVSEHIDRISLADKGLDYLKDLKSKVDGILGEIKADKHELARLVFS